VSRLRPHHHELLPLGVMTARRAHFGSRAVSCSHESMQVNGHVPLKVSEPVDCRNPWRPINGPASAGRDCPLQEAGCRMQANSAAGLGIHPTPPRNPGHNAASCLPVVPPARMPGSGSAQSARFRASCRPAPTLATRTRVEDSCDSFRRAISPRRADAGRLARKK